MSITCFLLKHKFDTQCKCSRCRETIHEWQGCRCERCGMFDHTQHTSDSGACLCKNCHRSYHRFGMPVELASRLQADTEEVTDAVGATVTATHQANADSSGANGSGQTAMFICSVCNKPMAPSSVGSLIADVYLMGEILTCASGWRFAVARSSCPNLPGFDKEIWERTRVSALEMGAKDVAEAVPQNQDMLLRLLVAAQAYALDLDAEHGVNLKQIGSSFTQRLEHLRTAPHVTSLLKTDWQSVASLGQIRKKWEAGLIVDEPDLHAACRTLYKSKVRLDSLASHATAFVQDYVGPEGFSTHAQELIDELNKHYQFDVAGVAAALHDRRTQLILLVMDKYRFE